MTQVVFRVASVMLSLVFFRALPTHGLEGVPGKQERKRILIVQIDDRDPNAVDKGDVVPFWGYTAAINRQYAENNGYDYKYVKAGSVPEGRHSAWAHVDTLRHLLATGDYDYIMKLDSDAMFATTDPLEAQIDFGPLEREEKDLVFSIDAMYYDLYECPRVHNLTTLERRCDAEGQLETIQVIGAEGCSAWFSVDAWKRGIHLGDLRGIGNDELEEHWLDAWDHAGVTELPAGATKKLFDKYGLLQRRQDLLQGRWWRDTETSPAMIAFGAFNSGVYLVKTSSASVAFFDDWWNMPNEACAGNELAPRFEAALRHLTSKETSRGACGTKAKTNSAFTLRSNGLEPLSCKDGSLQDYLAGKGIGGSPLYEQPALSLISPEHMERIEAYDPWDFNGPFSSLVWHPVGPAKQWRSSVYYFKQLLQQQQDKKPIVRPIQNSMLFGTRTWTLLLRAKDAIGWCASLASLGLFAAPTQTVWGRAGIYRTGSTSKVATGFPYFAGFAGNLIWVLYTARYAGQLLQPLVINSLGLLLNGSFMLCYWAFSTQKLHCSIMFAIILAVALYANHMALLLGSPELLGKLAAAVNVVALASPLAAASEVMRTKSVAKYPLLPLLMIFLQSSSWTLFGICVSDMAIIVPNFLGTCCGIVQILLYLAYASHRYLRTPPGSEKLPSILSSSRSIYIPRLHRRNRRCKSDGVVLAELRRVEVLKNLNEHEELDESTGAEIV